MATPLLRRVAPEVNVRTHTLVGVVAIVLSVLAIVGFQSPTVRALELCCSTLGQCPEGYKCCAPDGTECSPERVGSCRTYCSATAGGAQ